MIIIIEKGYLTSSCNNKKTRLIFDNVTKQLRFKNSARSINAFPFLLQSLYTIIIIIIWIYFMNSISASIHKADLLWTLIILSKVKLCKSCL